MTHTLHRRGKRKDLLQDYIVFSMAAQGFNDQDAAKRLVANLRILAENNPVNLGDDNRGSVLTGYSLQELIDKAGPKAYMAGVYTSQEQLKNVLRQLKEADNGMSVVVSGDFETVFEAAHEVGLKPHTVHLSLGVWGKTDKLPEESILEIVTMCGHGMVCPSHIRAAVTKVRKGEMTPEEAAKDLARPCTCGMFNPTRAAAIINRMCASTGGEPCED